MKALLFAAGLGTRLRPLTNDRPKALVQIKGQTLLEITVRKLLHFGFKDIVVNIHHFPDLMLETIEKSQGWGANIIISDERDFLLETGGGLKKAQPLLQGEEPFLVHNVDVIHDLDLGELYNYHLKNNALATLAVRKRQTSRYFILDSNMELVGWQNIKTGEVKLSKSVEGNLSLYGFSGIHVISPEIFPLLTETGKFSITPAYLRLAKTHLLQGFDHTDSLWMDVGKPENLKEIESFS